jgi:hypothetical protein
MQSHLIVHHRPSHTPASPHPSLQNECPLPGRVRSPALAVEHAQQAFQHRCIERNAVHVVTFHARHLR